MKYRFEVQGSVAEPYVVIIERSGSNLRATCDCAAGVNGLICKHRLSLFKGSDTGVVGGDRDKIGDLPALLSGTDVERAMQLLAVAEIAEAKAKKELSLAKQAVAKAMQS